MHLNVEPYNFLKIIMFLVIRGQGESFLCKHIGGVAIKSFLVILTHISQKQVQVSIWFFFILLFGIDLCVTLKKLEFRAIMKFLIFDGFPSTEFQLNIFLNCFPPFSTFQEFLATTTDENIETLNNMILDIRLLKFGEAIGISEKRVHRYRTFYIKNQVWYNFVQSGCYRI